MLEDGYKIVRRDGKFVLEHYGEAVLVGNSRAEIMRAYITLSSLKKPKQTIEECLVEINFPIEAVKE